MSDPPLSETDFRNKMAWVWTTLYGHQSIFHVEKGDEITTKKFSWLNEYPFINTISKTRWDF